VRILVDSCASGAQNVGDLAMLIVAVSRLRKLWPDASIQVITAAPPIVAANCGNVHTVPHRGRRLVLQHRLLGRLHRMLPAQLGARWEGVEHRLRMRGSALLAIAQRLKLAVRGQDFADVEVLLSAVREADLVVVRGAGVFIDALSENALGVLATLEMAISRRIPTAMFGQGFGPIATGELRRRAAEVLPSVNLIAVRERLRSPPLLASLGVNLERVVVTGDDAIELALQERSRSPQPGAAGKRRIGVNLRVAPYSGIDRDYFETLREALREASRAHQAELVPIPIAHQGQMDANVLRELLAGTAAGDSDGGASLNTPERVIHRISKCRVVLTGSYHAGVFALAQGIPTVALARSQYYVDKMSGLADQFGDGCEVVRLEPTLSASRLAAAIGAAWDNAERLQATLLVRASEQVERARAAYARLKTMVPSP
jgi:polysaccharide pyruvyl transferase WcaK-like protein